MVVSFPKEMIICIVCTRIAKILKTTNLYFSNNYMRRIIPFQLKGNCIEHKCIFYNKLIGTINSGTTSCFHLTCSHMISLFRKKDVFKKLIQLKTDQIYIITEKNS